jgi:hypothetical protein
MERWCARAYAYDHLGSTFRPLVIGPSAIPRITDVEQARALPVLALLSVAAHGHEPGDESVTKYQPRLIQHVIVVHPALAHSDREASGTFQLPSLRRHAASSVGLPSDLPCSGPWASSDSICGLP